MGFGIENVLFGLAGVQSFSLSLLLSPIIILLNLNRVNLQNSILKFGIFLLAYGTIVFYSHYSSEESFSPLVRQFLALAAGGCIFLAMKVLTVGIEKDRLSQILLITSTPYLLLGLFQKLRVLTNPFEGRVSSLFTEPSHYGDYLVLLIAPFLYFEVRDFGKRDENWKYFFGACVILWVLNFVFVQSGTAVLKVVSLLFLILIFQKNFLKQKLLLVAVVASIGTISLFVENSYVRNLLQIGIDMVANPHKFLQQHTFYDRFYPMYGVSKHLVSSENLFGYGLGSDFYEWKHVFLHEQHQAMIEMKPYGSFINANFPKVILYFGLAGIAWIVFLFRKSLRTNSSFLKMSLVNVLLSCFWGVSSFAQPYLWFWLALVDNDDTTDQHL